MTTRLSSGLRQAADTQSPVRVERAPKFANTLDGVVLRVGTKWALMAQTSDDGYFDGLVAFRLKDVKRVTSDSTFATVFAKTQPEWPPSFSHELNLDTTGGLLTGLGQSGGFLGIQKDKARSALWIGELDEVTSGFVYLHEVRPDATWHLVPLGYKLKAITTVEFGTRHLSALSTIAGARPAPRED